MSKACVIAPHGAPAEPGTGLPARAGIGLKPVHLSGILEGEHDLAFFEVHAENYMGAGGPAHRDLARVHARWPLSVHSVALSLGGAERPDPTHLRRLRALCERHGPEMVSEHLAWSSHGGVFYNDLLPVPYDVPTLARVAAHVDEVQDALGRHILIENPSTYVGFRHATMDEVDFLAGLARLTGCGLLLDVNNVFVSATNHGFDAEDYIDRFPAQLVGEIHLAGFAVDYSMDESKDESAGPPLLIDTHGAAIDERVWDLFARAVARTGPVPVLIERDNNIPPLGALLAEAHRAQDYLTRPDVLERGAA